MKKRKIIGLVLLISIVPLYVDCGGGSKTAKVVKITKTLASSFVSFSEIVSVINDLTVVLTNNTREKLTINLKEGIFEDVAQEWEKTWNKINRKITQLENKYGDIIEESHLYFQKMRELENETSDDALKSMMIKKTNAKEQEFEIAKNNTLNEIKKIKQMAKSGSDFHNVLLQDVMLTQISYRISELNRLESEARSICLRLNQFAKTGTMILR
jgi:hypothetical protein